MYSQRLISQFTVDILDRVDLFFRTSPIHAHVDIVIYFIQMDIFPARNTCIRGDKGFGNFFEKFSHAIKLISSTLNNIFYFIMHVIKINNFFTSSFAFLKINGMKKMWIMYLLSAFLKKIFSMKVCCYPSLAFVFIKVGPNKANLQTDNIQSCIYPIKAI